MPFVNSPLFFDFVSMFHVLEQSYIYTMHNLYLSFDVDVRNNPKTT